MPGLDDVDPDDVSFPDEEEPTDVPVANREAEAVAEEDRGDDDDALFDTKPNGSL